MKIYSVRLQLKMSLTLLLFSVPPQFIRIHDHHDFNVAVRYSSTALST